LLVYPCHETLWRLETLKPDGVQRGLVGEVIKRFEQRGFQLLALKFTTPSRQTLEEHYKDLKTKGFFPSLIAYMTSGPVVAMVWGGKQVVKTGRMMLGATNPLDSQPGTIRGDFCIDGNFLFFIFINYS
jgi:nucleoside-diphosphate kinase